MAYLCLFSVMESLPGGCNEREGEEILQVRLTVTGRGIERAPVFLYIYNGGRSDGVWSRMGRAEEGTAGGGGEGGVLREASARGSHTLSHAHSLGDKQALGCAGTPADRCCLCE